MSALTSVRLLDGLNEKLTLWINCHYTSKFKLYCADLGGKIGRFLWFQESDLAMRD